jgi:hypothetical protein
LLREEARLRVKPTEEVAAPKAIAEGFPVFFYLCFGWLFSVQPIRRFFGCSGVGELELDRFGCRLLQLSDFLAGSAFLGERSLGPRDEEQSCQQPQDDRRGHSFLVGGACD